jgi:hypothetical protein
VKWRAAAGRRFATVLLGQTRQSQSLSSIKLTLQRLRPKQIALAMPALFSSLLSKALKLLRHLTLVR